tara:strand:+ start:72 stop:701 length:630 start_codon:yes stop_codon:yes gene_type:complete
MSIDTYTNLKTTIANYLNRSDLTSYIPDFISLAETRLNNELRVREMEVIDTTTNTVSGTQDYSLPTNFIEAIYVLYKSDPYITLKYKSNFDFFSQLNSSVSSGIPYFFTIVGSKIYLGPKPDTATNLEIAHYKKITALSDSNATNDILTNYPNLYLYAALAESAPFIHQDERLTIWSSLYKESMQRANITSENGRTASHALQMSARSVV